MTGQTTAGAAPARTLTAADRIMPTAASTGAGVSIALLWAAFTITRLTVIRSLP